MGQPRGHDRADEVVDVELVDAAEDGGPLWFAPRRQTGRRAGRNHRRNRVIRIVVGLVVVAVAAVATVRQATHDALLAGLGHGGVVLLPLDGPLTERWRTQADEVTGDMGSLVLVRDAEGTRALDARTGALHWRRELAPAGATEVCRPLADFASRTFPAVGPQGPATSERGVTDVVCLRTSPVGSVDGDVPGSDVPQSTTLTALDGRSGEPARSVTVAGRVVASHVHDGDLVLVSAADDATLRLTRWHPSTGGILWRREVAPAEAAGLRFAGWQRGILTVAGRAGTLAYSLDSGHELRVTKPLPPQVVAVERRVLPRGGIEVVWGYYADVDADVDFPGGAGAVVHRDNSEVPLPGPPLRVAVDDGSAPSLVLVATSPTTVGAFDVGSGTLRWEGRHSASAQVSVRVDGIAVIVDGTVARGVDVRTGAVLWTTTGVTDEPGSLGLTDGERVLLRHTQDGRHELFAHDLRTGEVAWTGSVPDGTEEVLGLAEGRVVAVGPGWVAGLG